MCMFFRSSFFSSAKFDIDYQKTLSKRTWQPNGLIMNLKWALASLVSLSSKVFLKVAFFRHSEEPNHFPELEF